MKRLFTRSETTTARASESTDTEPTAEHAYTNEVCGLPQIVCTRHIGPLDTKTTTYRWDGPEDGVALLSDFVFISEGILVPPVGRVFSLGGIAMRRLPPLPSDFIPPFGVRVVRADRGICAYLRHAVPAVIGWRLRYLRIRIILTAHVWGLARYHGGNIPQWCDIYLVEKLASTWRTMRRTS
jgi:hypothetical protein